jgi:type IV pilus assembly protein PilC
MPRFMFQARTVKGQLQTGHIEGLDENEIKIKLKARNLTPLRIVPARASTAPGLFARRVPTKDLLIFTRQFATLINAGIPIVDSLRILGEGRRHELIKTAALGTRDAIEQGKRLADGMAQFPNVFDKLYVNMIRAGEEAGILDSILGRLAVYMEKSDKIKKQVRSAMIMPGLIVVVAAGVIALILTFIIPKFQELFTSNGKELPALTQMVVNWSKSFREKWYLFLGGAIAIPYAFSVWAKTDDGKAIVDRILVKMPAVGDLVVKSSVARMTRTLSTLLQAGIGVIEALEIAARTSGNKVIEEALIRSKDSVIGGKRLYSPLAKEKAIPDMVSQMIAIGEESGTLDQLLSKIADFYEDDVENAVKGVTSLIEPMMMVILGGIMAFLIIAMYLPVFELSGTQGGG